MICGLLWSSVAAAQTLQVEVCNFTKEDRTDEPVVIDLREYAAGKKIVGGVVESHRVVKDRPEQVDEIPSQLSGDQFLFVANVPAQSVATYTVTLSETQRQRSYEPRTHAHLKLWDRKYRYPEVNQLEFRGDVEPLAMYDAVYGHGAMWESELLGFRIYMDNRQSLDLYGKEQRQMELDVVNFYSTPEFRSQGYGEDILFAGQSVGAGSFRGLVDGKPAYIDSVGSRRQRVVESGPVRCIVEMVDKDWHYEGRTLQMYQYYTMYAGHRDVQVDIYLEGAGDDELSFVTGVQKLEKNKDGFVKLVQGDGAVMGSWGTNVPDKENAPDDEQTLGLGLYVPSQYVYNTDTDKHNYLAYLRPSSGHIRYYLSAYSCLQKDGKYTRASQWLYWVKRWKERVQEPCAINVMPIK